VNLKNPLWTIEFTTATVPAFFDQDHRLFAFDPDDVSRADLLTNPTSCAFLFVDVD